MRTIAHWDGDSFFASIEQASDRRLRGRPVAVGGERRGIVLSASREARRYGVRPGVFTMKACRWCAPLVVIPAHFDLYEQFAQQIVWLCEASTPLVEPVSVGAAYLDLTGTPALREVGITPVVTSLRQAVREWLRVSLSAGIASNKTVARIAARLRKPGGQVVVAPGEEQRFLAPLPVQWLPGVGARTVATLDVAGVRRIGHLARAPLAALELVLGRQALRLQRRAQGVDEEPVGRPQTVPDAYRQTLVFADDVWEEWLLLNAMRSLAERLLGSVRAAGVEVRRLKLTLRYTDRAESERTLVLSEPTAADDEVFPHLPGLLRGAWSRRVRIRAVALQASRIYQPSAQLNLFGPEPRPGSAELAAAIDAVRTKFGARAVARGYQLEDHRLRRTA